MHIFFFKSMPKLFTWFFYIYNFFILQAVCTCPLQNISSEVLFTKCCIINWSDASLETNGVECDPHLKEI